VAGTSVALRDSLDGGAERCHRRHGIERRPSGGPALIRSRFRSVTDYLLEPMGELLARAHTINTLKVHWPTSPRFVSLAPCDAGTRILPWAFFQGARPIASKLYPTPARHRMSVSDLSRRI
jgi:hypothetical protein